MTDDEGRFDRLPVRGEIGWGSFGVFGFGAAGERVERSVRLRQHAGVVETPHLDAVPEAAEDEPGAALFVEDEIGVDRVVVIGGL